MYWRQLKVCHPHSQKSFGVRIVNIEMKTGEGYLLDGCRAWTCELVATGIAEAQKGKMMSDLISRQAAIEALWKALYEYEDKTEKQFQESEDLDVGDWIGHRIFVQNMNDIDRQTILNLPSAQPDPRYTEEELRVFQHGISLSLLSKRSAQHWHYDEDTATEIKFLERLYEKVGADMRGEYANIVKELEKLPSAQPEQPEPYRGGI